jgi:hypothetical protein
MAQIATTFWLGEPRPCVFPESSGSRATKCVSSLGALIVLMPMRGAWTAPAEQPRPPPPGTTFAGFLGPRPPACRPPAETAAEVHHLFPEAPANDNGPIGRGEAHPGG